MNSIPCPGCSHSVRYADEPPGGGKVPECGTAVQIPPLSAWTRFPVPSARTVTGDVTYRPDQAGSG